MFVIAQKVAPTAVAEWKLSTWQDLMENMKGKPKLRLSLVSSSWQLLGQQSGVR